MKSHRKSRKKKPTLPQRLTALAKKFDAAELTLVQATRLSAELTALAGSVAYSIANLVAKLAKPVPMKPPTPASTTTLVVGTDATAEYRTAAAAAAESVTNTPKPPTPDPKTTAKPIVPIVVEIPSLKPPVATTESEGSTDVGTSPGASTTDAAGGTTDAGAPAKQAEDIREIMGGLCPDHEPHAKAVVMTGLQDGQETS